MNSFSSIYLKILKNKTIVIEAVDQIVKIRKHDHGLKSMILKFISVNFADNKIKKIRPIDFYNDYIEGVLLSYYTSSKGILIKSIDQVVYILGIDITIEENYKMLTQEAEQNELSLHKTRNTESRITENKYLELSRIVDTYIPLGEKIIQQMLVYELKQAYKSWQLEIKVKPLLPIKTYIENYIKHFIDLFMVEDEFILNYDSREYKNYLDIKPELINTVKKYNLVEFDLFGSSAKVFSHYVLPEESTLENFFSTLFSPNYIKTIFSAEIKYVRPILQKISSLTYELAMRLNEIITDYYNNKEVIFKDFIRNYDFFENAFFKIDAFNKLPLIFRKDVIRLKDFLEGACSIAFYICKHLKHPGIDAIFSDKNNFEIKIKVDDNINNSGKEGKVDDKSFNEIYVDNLTAFKKREYLYDYILPGFYDESHRYYLDIPRFVVYCNVNNFLTINSHFGYNAGDNLFIEMSRIIKETIYKISNTNGVEVIRLSGTEIVIYFNEIERAELIDKIIEMNRSISNLEIYSEKKSIPSISFSVGIFEEYKNSIFEENLEIVQKIMNFARKNGKNQTAFVKNSTYRLTKKELLDDIALAGRYLASVS